MTKSEGHAKLLLNVWNIGMLRTFTTYYSRKITELSCSSRHQELIAAKFAKIRRQIQRDVMKIPWNSLECEREVRVQLDNEEDTFEKLLGVFRIYLIPPSLSLFPSLFSSATTGLPHSHLTTRSLRHYTGADDGVWDLERAQST